MKIQPNVPTSVVLGSAGAADPRPAERTPDAPPAHRVLVSLSEDARWVASVTEEVRAGPPIRLDVVEAVKASLAAGTYEASVDLDVLVDRLLADL